MAIIGKLHTLRISPGSEQEARFIKILRSVDVDLKRVLCRPGYLFWTKYDEYILSDELWRLVFEDLRKKGII